MSDESFSLYNLVEQDPRYPVEAYLFVREALAFAADSLELGSSRYPREAGAEAIDVESENVGEITVENAQETVGETTQETAGPNVEEAGAGSDSERHMTGQQLCEAIRQYSLNQFGYMAKVVLKNWGIEHTSCFGDIVYNMIDVGIMKKSKQDERTHFDNVYKFDEVFQTHFAICDSLAQRRS